MVALYRIVRLRSFSWLLFCSARNWLRWRPALTRTQNFSWYVSIPTVYAVTLFVLFHQTGYWMVFNWSSLCSNWQTELQILYPRERLFCLFLLFSFWKWRGENVKKSTQYLSYFPQKFWPPCAQDYLMRKGSRPMIDKWLTAHARAPVEDNDASSTRATRWGFSPYNCDIASSKGVS